MSQLPEHPCSHQMDMLSKDITKCRTSPQYFSGKQLSCPIPLMVDLSDWFSLPVIKFTESIESNETEGSWPIISHWDACLISYAWGWHWHHIVITTEGAFQKNFHLPTSNSDWPHLQENALYFFPSRCLPSRPVQWDSNYKYYLNAAPGLPFHFEEKKTDLLWGCQSPTTIWWPTPLLLCPCRWSLWLFVEYLSTLGIFAQSLTSVAWLQVATYILTSQWGYSHQWSQHLYLHGAVSIQLLTPLLTICES